MEPWGASSFKGMVLKKSISRERYREMRVQVYGSKYPLRLKNIICMFGHMYVTINVC
jgi:hypothetical protein